MKNYFEIYSLGGIVNLIYNTLKTKLFYPRAKLVRFPIDFRGKKHISYGIGFTTGRYCRLEAYPIDKKSLAILIGKNVQINDFVHITGIKKVVIGDNVLIASKVYISDSSHGSYSGDENDSDPNSIPKERLLFHKEVTIGNNVWIGESVSILPGVIIGTGSIIGANSVVTKSIPDYSIAVGNPARVVKAYDFNTNRWVKS